MSTKSLAVINLKNCLFSGIEQDNKGYRAVEALYQACLVDANTSSTESGDADVTADEAALRALFACITDLRKEFRESSKISDVEKSNATLLYNRLSVALRLWISKQSTRVQGLIKDLELVKTRRAGGGRKPSAPENSDGENTVNTDESAQIVASSKSPAVTPEVMQALIIAAEKEVVSKLAQHLLMTYFSKANKELASFKKQFPKIYEKQVALYNHLQAIVND